MKVGIVVHCAICHRMKKPIGRSAPLCGDYCDQDCDGYYRPPLVGSLWPSETEAEFGYPVGKDGVAECDCIASGNPLKPKQHGADQHAKNCAIYIGGVK